MCASKYEVVHAVELKRLKRWVAHVVELRD